MIKSKGKIIYDPIAGKANNKWWVIVECDENIIKYYKYWVEKYYKVELNKPLFNAHISVVRGEEPLNKELWRYNHECEVDFYYSVDIENENGYWWLRVFSKDLEDLREKLGLNKDVKFGFHLTIGKDNWYK
jgi:hypothetical protein